jgi:hypothetical protein
MALVNYGKFLFDYDVYRANRDRFTPDELRPFAGEWLAWSLDGTTILAHDRDATEVVRQLREKGIDPECVMNECLPEAEHFDESI